MKNKTKKPLKKVVKKSKKISPTTVNPDKQYPPVKTNSKRLK